MARVGSKGQEREREESEGLARVGSRKQCVCRRPKREEREKREREEREKRERREREEREKRPKREGFCACICIPAFIGISKAKVCAGINKANGMASFHAISWNQLPCH